MKKETLVKEAIKEMYENRIAELDKSIGEARRTAESLSKRLLETADAKCALTGLWAIHDHLSIAASVLSAVREFSSCLGVMDAKDKIKGK